MLFLYIATYIPAQQLAEHLTATLPHYMIPQHFVRLSAIPLTSNGKVNRKALLPPAMKRSPREDMWPRKMKQSERWSVLWEDILGVDQVSRVIISLSWGATADGDYGKFRGCRKIISLR